LLVFKITQGSVYPDKKRKKHASFFQNVVVAVAVFLSAASQQAFTTSVLSKNKRDKL